MRLLTIASDHGGRAALEVGDAVVETTSAARAAGLRDDVRWERSKEVLARPEDWSALQAAARSLAHDGAAHGVHRGSVRRHAPVPDPEKIVCLGLNYRDHAREAGLPVPEVPLLFAKYPNSLTGPADPIVLPAGRDRVDYEVELAVVIGRTAKDVPEEEALSYVGGAMALNDVSDRDLQLETSQWMAGKIMDSFAPCGPALVTLDELGDIQGLRLLTRVNGQVLQDSNTADMIFSVAQTVSYLSRLMTLSPGDIVSTGTPAGVGFSRVPPVLLREGDLVEVEVERIGTLHNTVAVARAGGSTAIESAATAAG